MSNTFATDVATAGCAVLSSKRPQVDFDTALRRLEGDTALLSEIIGMFLNNHSGMIDEIRDALEAHDAVRLQKSAHRFKGCVGYLGAEELAQLAHRLERIGASGNLERASDCFVELTAGLNDVLQALRERAACVS